MSVSVCVDRYCTICDDIAYEICTLCTALYAISCYISHIYRSYERPEKKRKKIIAVVLCNSIHLQAIAPDYSLKIQNIDKHYLQSSSMFVFFDIFWFRCPRDGEIREKWLEAIKSHQSISPDDEKSISYFVCSEHFGDSQFYKSSYKGSLRLKPGEHPTIFPKHNEFVLDTEELTLNTTPCSSTNNSSIPIDTCDQ